MKKKNFASYMIFFTLTIFVALAILNSHTKNDEKKLVSAVSEDLNIVDEEIPLDEDIDDHSFTVHVTINNEEFDGYSFILSNRLPNNERAKREIQEIQKSIKEKEDILFSNKNIRKAGNRSSSDDDMDEMIKNVMIRYAEFENIPFDIHTLDYTVKDIDM